MAVSLETPWPVAGNGGDDDEFRDLLLTAWVDACEKVGVELDPSAKEMELVS